MQNELRIDFLRRLANHFLTERKERVKKLSRENVGSIFSLLSSLVCFSLLFFSSTIFLPLLFFSLLSFFFSSSFSYLVHLHLVSWNSLLEVVKVSQSNALLMCESRFRLPRIIQTSPAIFIHPLLRRNLSKEKRQRKGESSVRRKKK